MKKLTFSFLTIALLSANTLFAQEDAKFRFGIKAMPAINWFKPMDVKQIKNDGASFKFGYGLITEFRLNKVASFVTGLEMTQNGGSLEFVDTALYIPEGSTDAFLIKSRNFKINYIDLPIALKMKTPEIGAMTYFAQFGFNTSFKWNGKATDDGFYLSNTGANPAKLEDMIITQDIGFLKLGLNVGAGCEWNIAGSTSLLFSANFNNGFVNSLIQNSKTLSSQISPVKVPFKQEVKSQYISVTVGVLF